MLNCRLVVDVGSDFDSLNFAPFRLPYEGTVNPWCLKITVVPVSNIYRSVVKVPKITSLVYSNCNFDIY